jgi:hypothetical protein
MVGARSGDRMGAMNSTVDCPGSLKLNAAAEMTTVDDTWTGERPERGERVEFGYAGSATEHPP